MNVSRQLEGAHRPGHFEGMLTVVLKLLMVSRPRTVYLGEKDYQQLMLVKGMVDAFFLDINVVGCPTVRSADGLALSSRHAHLSDQHVQLALQIHSTLQNAPSCDEAKQHLESVGFRVEYLVEQWGRRLVAVNIAGVRLIDNVTYHASAAAGD